MTIVKRLRLLTAVLGVAAASAAVVTTVFGDIRPNATPADARREPKPPSMTAAQHPVHRPAGPGRTSTGPGKPSFAWQVKPALPAAARGRTRHAGDGGHLGQPGRGAAQRAAPDRRRPGPGPGARTTGWTCGRSTWTTPRPPASLTGGFKPAADNDGAAAAAELADDEYAAGAVGPEGRARNGPRAVRAERPAGSR